MIQINLLPPEYRPRPGTPVARFASIVVGVILITCAAGAFVYTHLIELAKVENLRDARAEEAKAKEIQRDRSLSLQRELDVYEKRRTAIQTINRSRLLWSRKLDQFFDIVTAPEGEQPVVAWVEDLEVPPQPVTSRKKKVLKKGEEPDGGFFRFNGFLAVSNEHEAPAHSSAFFKALTGDPDNTARRTEFYADFLRISNPNVQIEDFRGQKDVEYDPPIKASYKYELVLKAPAVAPPKTSPPRGTK